MRVQLAREPEVGQQRRARDDAPLLSDFGLALDPEEPEARLSRTGQLLGTPGFWAPEQARGERHAVSARTDVWGLGGVLYAALTGSPPTPQGSLAEALDAAERPPPPPSRLRPGIPAGVERVCVRCLAPDPAARLASPREVLVQLQRSLTPAASGSRRGAALASALLLAGAGAFAAWPARPSPDLPGPASVATRSAADPGALVAQAERHLARREWDRTVELCSAAIAIDPACQRAWLDRGIARGQLGDDEGAIADSQRAAELDPRDPFPVYNRGVARGNRGDQRGKVEDMDRALALDPHYAKAWWMRAQALLQLQDAPGAERDARRAVELAPDLAGAWGTLATARGLQGDLQGELEGLTRSLALVDDPQERYSRALARLKADDVEGARADLNRSLELDPSFASAWHNRGTLLVRARDYEGAESDFSRARELEPGFLKAWVARGSVRVLLQDPRGAIADFERYLALAPADDPLGPFVQQQLAAARAAR